MARDISPSLEAETLKDGAGSVLRPALLFELQCVSHVVRLWSGLGSLEWNGHVYTGIGTMGTVDVGEETLDIKAAGTKYVVSGIPADLRAVALADVRQGRPARLYLAVFDENGTLIDATLVHEGLTDVPTLEASGETCRITITAESAMADLERARTARFTSEDQKRRYPDDEGFAFVQGLQDKKVVWG